MNPILDITFNQFGMKMLAKALIKRDKNNSIALFKDNRLLELLVTLRKTKSLNVI